MRTIDEETEAAKYEARRTAQSLVGFGNPAALRACSLRGTLEEVLLVVCETLKNILVFGWGWITSTGSKVNGDDRCERRLEDRGKESQA